MNKVYLSLGSNIGNKVDNLDKAVDILRNNTSIHKLIVSDYYTTDPMGYVDQDEFVNIAVGLTTDLEPLRLLDLCQLIEEKLERKRLIHWGPRSIDVDIIYYDDIEINESRLIVPHPRMYERNFVLTPLKEIAPELTILGSHIDVLLDKVEKGGVRKMNHGQKTT